MAFVDEWVDKKNKTATAPGDKLNADDLNLLARGILEALAKNGGGEITKLSQLINDMGFISIVDEIINDISVAGSEGGLNISAYYLNLSGGETTLKGNKITLETYDDADINVKGGKFAIEEPVNANHAASKGYVDSIVGNIGTALGSIISIQEELIAQGGNGDMELTGVGDA